MKARWSGSGWLVLLLLAGRLGAETAEPVVGQLAGQVRDQLSQQALPGAYVIVEGTRLGASTDAEGRFRIAGVPEEVYTLTISFIGFEESRLRDVRVVRGKTTVIPDVELTPAPVRGEEVVVTSGYFEREARRPVATYSYNREEIRRSPGASGDVLRAMETLPGVSSAGGEFSSFSVRGGSPKDNIILIDNIPFDRVTHFDGGATEEQDKLGGRFSIFAPNLVERAEFQAGGFSAIYGGRNASLLNLTIREGNPEDRTIDGRVDVLGQEVNISGPLGLGRNSGLLLSVRHEDFTRILEWTGQGEFGSPRFLDIISKATTDVGRNDRLSVLGILSTEAFDRRVQDLLDADVLGETSLETADFHEHKGLLAVTWRHLRERGFVESSLYGLATSGRGRLGRAEPLPADWRDVTSATDLTTRGTRRLDEDEVEVGLRSVWTHIPSPRLTLRTGLEGSMTSFDNRSEVRGLDTLYVFDAADRRPPGQLYLLLDPAQVNHRFEERLDRGAGFGEVSWASGRVSTNLGLRYEYTGFNGEHLLSPRASAAYDLGQRTRLTLAGGVYYQSPDVDVIVAHPANRDLRNERAIHAVAGWTRYLRDDLKLTVEAYTKRFDDLVTRPDRTSQVRTNAGDGWTSGTDLSLVKRLTNRLYGQVNYSFSHGRRDDHDGAGAYPSDFDQPHVFNMLGGYEVNKEWSLSAKWKYATGRPVDDYIVHADVLDDPAMPRYAKEVVGANGDRLPDFHSLNIRLDWRKQLGRVALVSFVDIVNVYNYLNVNETRFLPLTGLEDARGFEILPTMGTKIEF
jgi:hypothetical protein